MIYRKFPNSIGTIIITDIDNPYMMFMFRRTANVKGICVFRREEGGIHTRIYDSTINDEDAQMLGANANAIYNTLMQERTQQFKPCFADFESDPFDPSIMANYREDSEETEE